MQVQIRRPNHATRRLDGKDAPALAAIRADELLSAGDLDGYAVYKRVMNATEELLARVRPEINQ